MSQIHRLAVIAFAAGALMYGQDGDLIYAAQQGDISAVNALLQSGVDANTHRSPHVAYHTSALIEAAANGHLDVMKALLAAKADVNDQRVGMAGGPSGPASRPGGTALVIASSNGNLEIVQALLAAKADVNAEGPTGTALLLASQNGHAEVVKALVTAGADVDSQCCGADRWPPLFYAADSGHFEVVKVLLAAKANPNPKVTFHDDTILVRAIKMNHLDIARALVGSGANVTTTGVTPLMAAAGKSGPGSLELVQTILAAHADVNVGFDNVVESNPANPSTLIRAGAAVLDPIYKGATPLGLAASSGSAEIMQALLAPGLYANVNAKQKDGNTPLTIAAAKGRADVVRLLLVAKADVNATNDKGATAMTLALQNNHPDVVEILKGAGAGSK